MKELREHHRKMNRIVGGRMFLRHFTYRVLIDKTLVFTTERDEVAMYLKHGGRLLSVEFTPTGIDFSRSSRRFG